MTFALADRESSWMEGAPIHIERSLELNGPPDQVFSVLADHVGWTKWFKGMRRVRIDGAAHGVGGLRTVWVGAARVQERFVCWDENERLTFNIVSSSLPGMRAMTEDWILRASTDTTTTLTVRIAVEPAGLLRAVPFLIRFAVASSTKGGAGIATMFPAPSTSGS